LSSHIQVKGANVIEQQRGEVNFLQFNHYLSFPEVVHGIFTRQGGRSKGQYQSLNTSCSTGDSADNVISNRLLVLQSLGIQTYPCATLWAIHSPYVVPVDRDTWSDWRDDWPYRSSYMEQQKLVWALEPLRLGDALVTNQPGVALALAFADCVPLLLYDPQRKAIGLAHMGWRGAARGMGLAVIEAMCKHFNCQPQNILAGIGPSIGPCCNEVSKYVQNIFEGREQFDDMPIFEKYRKLVRESAVFSLRPQRDTEHLQLNLWETIRNQLLMAGLSPEHIELARICTSCNIDRFFSHRGERGKTGRFAAVFALQSP
jgi:polyphenol oxidase